MSAHFSIDMLPAREGDCLWIEYGDGGRTHRILVDGGRSSAYDTVSQRIAALPPDERAFELLVCTHVDADHIEGLLKLVEDPALDATFRDVWFNGFVHLKRPTGAEMFGAKQGERLSDGIVERRWSWNKAFGHGSVVVPDEGGLPVLALDGGMSITLLSPTWDKLERLRPTWKRECEKAGIVPGVAPVTEPPDGIERFGALNADTVLELAAAAFRKDTSRANGSSIAFLASFGGKTALLGGDAHADIVSGSLARLSGGAKVPVEAFKLSHHGSKGTLSPELLDMLDCARFLVSTDGSRHDHPDREAIARVVAGGSGAKALIGNYRSENMLEWDIAALRRRFGYTVEVPPRGENGVKRVDLL